MYPNSDFFGLKPSGNPGLERCFGMTDCSLPELPARFPPDLEFGRRKLLRIPGILFAGAQLFVRKEHGYKATFCSKTTRL
jgi:hypothetical protein